MDESSRAKLKEAIHFICNIANDFTLGSIRLSKILFFADKTTYCKTLTPMFADEYVKGPQGPYLRELRFVLDELKSEHKVTLQKIAIKRRYATEIKARVAPKIEFLSPAELELLEDLTLRICTDYSAHEISEASHNSVWEMAVNDEPMPLAAQLTVTHLPPSQKMMKWAVKDEGEGHVQA